MNVISMPLADIFEKAAGAVDAGTSLYCCHAIYAVCCIGGSGFLVDRASAFFAEHCKPQWVRDAELAGDALALVDMRDWGWFGKPLSVGAREARVKALREAATIAREKGL